MPFRIEVVDGVREEGKEERDACLFKFALLLELSTLPLCKGRFGCIVVIMLPSVPQHHLYYQNVHELNKSGISVRNGGPSQRRNKG